MPCQTIPSITEESVSGLRGGQLGTKPAMPVCGRYHPAIRDPCSSAEHRADAPRWHGIMASSARLLYLHVRTRRYASHGTARHGTALFFDFRRSRGFLLSVAFLCRQNDVASSRGCVHPSLASTRTCTYLLRTSSSTCRCHLEPTGMPCRASSPRCRNGCKKCSEIVWWKRIQFGWPVKGGRTCTSLATRSMCLRSLGSRQTNKYHTVAVVLAIYYFDETILHIRSTVQLMMDFAPSILR